jgi:hypothetical protein
MRKQFSALDVSETHQLGHGGDFRAPIRTTALAAKGVRSVTFTSASFQQHGPAAQGTFAAYWNSIR